MATLKTTIALESNSLFPAPISFTKVINETLVGSQSSFQTNVLTAGALQTLFESNESIGNSGVLYFYANASTANTESIDLVLDNKSTDQTYFMRLLPGSVAYLPICAADAAGIKISARNNNPGETATITYFYGSKD